MMVTVMSIDSATVATEETAVCDGGGSRDGGGRLVNVCAQLFYIGT